MRQGKGIKDERGGKESNDAQKEKKG